MSFSMLPILLRENRFLEGLYVYFAHVSTRHFLSCLLDGFFPFGAELDVVRSIISLHRV